MTSYRGITRDQALMSVGMGWADIIHDLYDCMPEDTIVEQVKEKFGSLRFYYSYGDDKFDDAVSAAEKKSLITCERCGEPGSIEQTAGWWLCLCPACKIKREADMEEQAKKYVPGAI